MKEKLKPCLFCGKDDIGVKDEILEIRKGSSIRRTWAYCRYCGSEGRKMTIEAVDGVETDIIAAATEAWNKRKRSEVLTEGMLDAIENPLQELDNMADPLEPIKVVSAMESEAMKMEMRKEKAPGSISILDYTIYAALWKRIPYELGKDEQGEFVCPTCGTWIYSGEEPIEKRRKLYQPYCQNCGQRLSYLAEGENDRERNSKAWNDERRNNKAICGTRSNADDNSRCGG